MKFFLSKELLEYVGTSRLMSLFSRSNSKGSLLHEPPTRQENISDDDLEFKREVRAHVIELVKSMETVEKLLCHVSSWDKLRKSVAYLLRFKSRLLNKE